MARFSIITKTILRFLVVWGHFLHHCGTAPRTDDVRRCYSWPGVFAEAAWSHAINDLPRLGYFTFVDVILVSTFVVTAFVVVFNVILKRLELAGRDARVARLDTPMIWLYPLSYVLMVAVTYRQFFVLA